MRRIILGLLIGILSIMSIATPVLAIGNPNTINFTATGINRQYNVFNNVLQTGDWLIDAEGYVFYNPVPTDYSPTESFLFQLLDTTGTNVLASTPLQSFGDRPISIYLSKAQADGLGLVIGTNYVIRIVGNPNVFASTVGNIVQVGLSPADYIDQSLSGNTTATNFLYQAMLKIALDMQSADNVTTYLNNINGVQYVTSLGATLFLLGIPNLNNMCPILFQNSITTLINETPSASGAYANTITIQNQWGATTANGLTALGMYIGVSQKIAGTVVFFILMLGFAVFFLYPRLQNVTSLVLFMAITPFIGTFMGFIPIPIVFDVVLFVMIMAGYYFVSRGTL